MMKSPKKILPHGTILLLFAAAVIMLLFGSIGSARAALTYYSEDYTSRLQMYNIGVTLLENDVEVAKRNYDSSGSGAWEETSVPLLEHMIPEGEILQIGRSYPEELKVVNTGTVDQYVRVTIYKYWTEAPAEGEEADGREQRKLQDLDSEMIMLNLTEGSGWLVDESSSTKERMVLYYSRALAVGETTEPFADELKINNSILTKVEEKPGAASGNIMSTYIYDNKQFWVDVKVDAVQEHNAADAVWSAWGRRVQVSDGVLSLSD